MQGAAYGGGVGLIACCDIVIATDQSAFALTEATLALSRLVGHFRIARADERPVLPAAVVTTQPDHAPAFRLTVR